MPLNYEAFLSNLSRLGIPTPDYNTLSDIYELEGDYLSKAIIEIDKGNARAEKYLSGICTTVMPILKERLRNQNLMIPPLKVLVDIGKKEGPEFDRRLRVWDSTGEDDDNARYVRQTLAKHLQKHNQLAPNTEDNRNHQAQRQDHDQHQKNMNHDRSSDETRIENDRRRFQNQPLYPENTRQPDLDYQNQQEDDFPNQEEESSEQNRDYISHHVYGGKFAACFTADKTRSGRFTVRIEAAEAKGPRSYEWSDKVSIQLSGRELPLVLATLMQWMPKFEGKGHGTNNEKWFTLENQPGKTYLKVNCKGKDVRGIPIMAGDSYSLCTLIIGQMLKNDQFLTADVLLTLVRKQAEIASFMTHGNGRNSHDQYDQVANG